MGAGDFYMILRENDQMGDFIKRTDIVALGYLEAQLLIAIKTLGISVMLNDKDSGVSQRQASRQ